MLNSVAISPRYSALGGIAVKSAEVEAELPWSPDLIGHTPPLCRAELSSVLIADCERCQNSRVAFRTVVTNCSAVDFKLKGCEREFYPFRKLPESS